MGTVLTRRVRPSNRTRPCPRPPGAVRVAPDASASPRRSRCPLPGRRQHARHARPHAGVRGADGGRRDGLDRRAGPRRGGGAAGGVGLPRRRRLERGTRHVHRLRRHHPSRAGRRRGGGRDARAADRADAQARGRDAAAVVAGPPRCPGCAARPARGGPAPGRRQQLGRHDRGRAARDGTARPGRRRHRLGGRGGGETRSGDLSPRSLGGRHATRAHAARRRPVRRRHRRRAPRGPARPPPGSVRRLGVGRLPDRCRRAGARPHAARRRTRMVTDEDVSYPRGGDTLRAYAAWSADAPTTPGLVLIPDVRGLGEHYRDVARRFAAEGFFVLAVDLYSREGAPALPDMEAVFRWMRELPDDRVLADLGAAVTYVGRRAETGGRPIGITGFCMGGQYALMAACSVPGLAACVSWYGMLRYAERHDRKPASPLDLAPRLGCPYLGLFGAEDALIPQADVEELRDLLARSGKTFEIHSYAGAGHAFFNDTRPDAYRPDAAADAWPRAIAFLRRHVGAPS